MTARCPYCRHGLGEGPMRYVPHHYTVVAGDRAARLSPGRGAVLHTLIEAGARGITREGIYTRLYARPDGGGPTKKMVDVNLCHIRKALASLDAGLGIVTVPGSRAGCLPGRFALTHPLVVVPDGEGGA